MIEGSSGRSRTGREILGEVRDRSKDSLGGPGQVGDPRGGPRWVEGPVGSLRRVEGPLGKSRTGWETLGKVRDGSRDPRGFRD